MRFSTIGLAATIAYFLVANVLVLAKLFSPGTASLIAYVAGMAVSYFGQKLFTFRIQGRQNAMGVRFVILSMFGLAISYGLVQFAVNILHLQAFWGILATCIFIPIFNFVLMKLWVFKH